jgi:hypothetical protein
MPLLIFLSCDFPEIYSRDVAESALIRHIFLSNKVNAHERQKFS